MGALTEQDHQSFTVHAKSRSVNLSDRASRGGAETRDQGHTHKAFLADQTYFHTFSIGEHTEN